MALRTIETAIVTGPTGSVGTALCAHLRAQGVAVWAVIRPDSPRAAVIPEGLRVARCDLADLASLPERMPGVRADAFFHLAWAGTTGAARDDADIQLDNVRHAVDAVRAAKAMGCRVFVGAGSQAEYGPIDGPLRADTPAFPETGYGIAKLCAGRLTRLECRKLGLDHVWTRILSVYGPYMDPSSLFTVMMRALLRGETPALTGCEQAWDFLYSGDAAEALRLCAERGRDGAVYPLGSGVAIPLRDYVEALRDAIDPALPLGFGALPYAPGQAMRLVADISTLREDTGFEPSTPFDTGIRRTIEWMKAAL